MEERLVIWLQRWTDVLFLHFPVPESELRPHVPRRLEIDTFHGQAWISYVFFRLDLRPAWLPSLPGFSSLLELNVRTYVRYRGQAGIYFVRMYADNRLAISASRLLTPLCYEWAKMGAKRREDGTCELFCQPAKSVGALCVEFDADLSRLAAAAEDSLEAWLLERYRLFVAQGDEQSSGERMVATTVEHSPWLATAAENLKCNWRA
jgi:uncharacterized protein YqjF (DUF2071 family)